MLTPGVEGREGRVRFGHVPIFAFPVFLLKIDGRPTAAQMDAVLRFPLFFFFRWRLHFFNSGSLLPGRSSFGVATAPTPEPVVRRTENLGGRFPRCGREEKCSSFWTEPKRRSLASKSPLMEGNLIWMG